MTRGLGIDRAGNRAGDALGKRRWLGGVVVAAASLVAAAVAGVAGLANRNPLAAFAGAVIIVLGKPVGLVQAIAWLQGQRGLTEAEAALLTTVYRGSVELSAIRLVPGRSGVFGLSDRPFTLGATIYLKAPALRDDILVHECAHVWQFQHLGPRYAFDAVWAQLRRGKSAYDWAAELRRGRQHWRDFNREAQAEFLQDIARHRVDFFDDDPVAPAARFALADGTDHSELARATVARVRAGLTR